MTHKFVTRLIALVFVLGFLSTSALAQMILPPEDIATFEGRRRFAEQLMREMPTLASNNVINYSVDILAQDRGMVSLMDNLMQMVRQDPKYMALAAVRPLPLTFEFYTVKASETTQVAVNQSFVEDLKGYFKAEHLGVFKQSEDEFVYRIEARIAELALAGATAQSNGIITGLGSLFPADSRREILGQKTLELRVTELKKAFAKVNEAQLKETFASERFGLPREQLTKALAIKLLDDALEREQELIRLISLLELNSKDVLSEEEWPIDSIVWMLFEGKGVPDFLETRDLDKKLGNFFGALKSQAKSAFTSEQSGVKVEAADKKIIIKEVPPHLAVFRSCTSSDCSTGSSWAYPFSPMERNYYIYLESNPQLEIGYISGNILEIDGVPTFYLRDITGVNLSPAQIDIIIPGFAAALPYLGVPQMAVAHESFHQGQNHYPPQHQRITQIIQTLPEVKTTFTDAWIRTQYLDRVVATAGYDSPATHARARLWKPEDLNYKLAPVRVAVLNGVPVTGEPGRKLSQKELLGRIRHAYLASNPLFLNGTSEDYSDWSRLFAILENDSGLYLKEYYAAVEAEFKKAGIRLSNSIQREFPDLFYKGHLAATDAFMAQDKTLLARTYELVVERYVVTQNFGVFAEIGHEQRTSVLESAAMKKAAAQFLSRQRPADQTRVNELWNAGFNFDFEMSPEQFLFMATHANPQDPNDAMDLLERTLVAGKMADTDVPRPLLNLVLKLLDNYKAEDETPSVRAARILSRLTFTDEELVSEIKHSVKDEDNVKIRFPLAVALLRSGLELDSESTAIGFVFVQENIRNREIPAEYRREAQAVLDSIPKSTQDAFTATFAAWAERKERKRREKEDCEVAAGAPRPRAG